MTAIPQLQTRIDTRGPLRLAAIGAPLLFVSLLAWAAMTPLHGAVVVSGAAVAAHRERFGAPCSPNVCYYPEFRITSYNVCYTKLLRSLAARARKSLASWTFFTFCAVAAPRPTSLRP